NESVSPIGVQITDDSKTKEQKVITFRMKDPYTFGDYIKWKNDYWLTVMYDDIGGIYQRGIIQKCVSSLRWLDSEGLIQEAWFTYRLDFYRGAGVNDDKVITRPSERRYIYVQKNEDTLRLRKGQRFIFDGRPWKLTAIDGLLS
ncbi:hypothetical protein, partial [Paenibacillus elgii]|uniref:hypothetical protein n=1 Tax=Paenibacillus elgii TaxID=189691 RepID=UPI0020403028